MAAPKRREASVVFWRSPQEQPCSIAPMDGDYGVVEADVFDGQVVIHGRNCLYTVRDNGDTVETNLAELEITVPLVRCQIHWKFVERKETEEVERSIYFKRD